MRERWGNSWSVKLSKHTYLSVKFTVLRGWFIETPNNYNSNIKIIDQHTKCISNIFEILQELPKYDPKTKTANTVRNNGEYILASHRVATNFKFVLKKMQYQWSRAKGGVIKLSMPIFFITALEEREHTNNYSVLMYYCWF